MIRDLGPVLGAILLNVTAQLAIKLAGKAGPLPRLQLDRWHDWLGSQVVAWLFAGLAAYGMSFLLTTLAYRHNDLSLISPLMAGAIISLTVLAAWAFLAEPIGLTRMAGIVLIIGGIVLVSRR